MADTTATGHVFPDESRARDGLRSAHLEWRGARSVLWFRDQDGRMLDARLADVYLLGSLLHWMGRGEGVHVHVHGAVSRSLLSNLDEWQAAMHSLLPDRYSPVVISADEVVVAEPARSARAIASYSGGLDSTCTAIRHARGLAGWRTEALDALLFVHGFDIALDRAAEFDGARERALRAAEVLGVELRSVSTNVQDLGQDWELVHGLALAAALQLHSPEFGVGLIGSSAPYFRIHLPWGSNPITDPLLSSGTMRIRHDGAALSRIAKVRVVAREPELLAALRVCWQGELLSRNCGRCEKCVRTYWALHIAGVRQPACFDGPVDVPPSKVRMAAPKVEYWREMLRLARAEGDDEAVAYIVAVLNYQRVRGALRRVGPLREVAIRARRRPGWTSRLFS
jgi:hypothetical protein